MTDRTARAWPWVVDAGLVLYMAYVAYLLAVRGPAFSGVFADFGMELPAATSLVSRFCTATNLYLSVGVLALVLAAKNRLFASEISRLGASFLVLLLVLAFKAFTDEALLQPMLHLFRTVRG